MNARSAQHTQNNPRGTEWNKGQKTLDHINRCKKPFDKVQQPFMTEILKKQKEKDTSLLTNLLYENTTSDIMLSWGQEKKHKDLGVSPQVLLYMLILLSFLYLMANVYHSCLICSIHLEITAKVMKEEKDMKDPWRPQEEIKLCIADDVSLYAEYPKEYIKKLWELVS